ncbi:MAG: hypothetical protein OHK0038_15340 [Flammeovirgaceae bacterium]
MNKATTLIVIAILFSFSYHIEAQEFTLTLNDVVYKKGESEINLLKSLKEKSKVSPFSPEFYHFMGVIYYQKMLAHPVLTDYKGGSIWADSAFFYLQKAKDLLDDKNVKKSEDYYNSYLNAKSVFTGKDKSILSVLHDDLKKLKEEATTYKRKSPDIYHKFADAAETYKKAAAIFEEVSKSYATKDDMYFLSDKNLITKLKQLVSLYENSMRNLQEFNFICQEFPIKDLQKKITVVKIEDFKKDGHTKPNFLDKELNIWDYKTFSEEVIRVIQQEIEPLRRDLQFFEDKLNKEIKAFETGQPLVGKFKMDKHIENNLKRFNQNSIVLDLFHYKVAKIDFLNEMILKGISDRYSTSPLSPEDRMNVISEVIAECLLPLDSIEQKIRNDHKKDKFFLDKNYPELERFARKERKEIGKTLFPFVGEVTPFVSNDRKFAYNQKQEAFPLFVDRNMMLKDKEFLTLSVKHLGHGKSLVAGFQWQRERRVPYIAYVENESLLWYVNIEVKNLLQQIIDRGVLPEENIEGIEADTVSVSWKSIWSKPIMGEATVIANDENTLSTIIQVYPDGYAARAVNVLSVHNLMNGEVITQKLLDINQYPCSLEMDADGVNYIASFKGEANFNVNTLQRAKIAKIEASTGNSLWKINFALAGYIETFKSFSEGYVLGCNFAQIKGLEGSWTTQGACLGDFKPNPFIAILDKTGKILKKQAFNSEKCQYLFGIYAGKEGKVYGLGFLGDRTVFNSSEPEMVAYPVDMMK